MRGRWAQALEAEEAGLRVAVHAAALDWTRPQEFFEAEMDGGGQVAEGRQPGTHPTANPVTAPRTQRQGHGCARGAGRCSKDQGQPCSPETSWLVTRRFCLAWLGSLRLDSPCCCPTGFDLIIASDLLYNATEDSWPQLVETLATLCRRGQGDVRFAGVT